MRLATPLSRSVPRVALLAGILAAGSACRGTPSSSTGPFPAAPVILISVDTLRADHVGAYGAKEASTPRIDALAREGIAFEDAYSHCPLTLPSHSSLFTGLLPPRHGVRDNIGFTLKETYATLASRFKEAGLRTGGAISAYVLRKQTGIGRGFEFYDDALEVEGSGEALGSVQRDGAVAVAALAAWVEAQKGARLFAFLHLYEPHSPYTPPERYRGRGKAYDGDVAYADELVGRFLDHLKAAGLYDRAVIALTSDHGEGLMDHGEEEHGIFLYREALRVPLVVRLPGGNHAGERVRGTVGHVDLAATLLDLAGVPASGLDGSSLRSALAGGSVQGQPVYSETLYPRYHFGWSDLYAATDTRYRYIRAPRHELFDLERDPGEKENLVASRAAPANAMRQWLDRKVAAAAVSAPDEVAPEVREKLQALGYIGVGVASPTATADLPDPKDKIASYEDLRRALALRKEGKSEEAVAQFKAVLKANPRMLDAWEMMGLTLAGLGRNAEGIAAFVRALELDPGRAETNMALAKIYALDGKSDLAVKHAEIASSRNPAAAFEVLAQLLMDKGQADQAASFARKSVAADDQRMMAHFILGVAAQKAGRYEEGLASYRKAASAKERQKKMVLRNLHANMADCLARLGREAEAEQEFLAELQAIPLSREGRTGLAMLYRSQGRDDAARTILAGIVTADPHPSADAYWAVVRTFTVLGDRAAAQEWAGRARAQFPQDPRFRPDPPRGS